MMLALALTGPRVDLPARRSDHAPVMLLSSSNQSVPSAFSRGGAHLTNNTFDATNVSMPLSATSTFQPFGMK